MERPLQERGRSIILEDGVLQNAFPTENDSEVKSIKIDNDIAIASKSFNHGKKLSPFLNAGIIMNGKIFTSKVEPSSSKDFFIVLMPNFFKVLSDFKIFFIKILSLLNQIYLFFHSSELSLTF